MPGNLMLQTQTLQAAWTKIKKNPATYSYSKRLAQVYRSSSAGKANKIKLPKGELSY